MGSGSAYVQLHGVFHDPGVAGSDDIHCSSPSLEYVLSVLLSTLGKLCSGLPIPGLPFQVALSVFVALGSHPLLHQRLGHPVQYFSY